ncbi:hypothetical protein [Fusobacterium necrophorum]|uniref:hypothetical protein n=1 Tax=Fusobacterium necrophorum TaxID=859 RepID=UPI00370F150E
MRARVKNISRNKKLENIIDSMQIKYPRTNEISSFEVSFQLESPDIISGDTVEVIVREKEAEFLKIQGKAQVVRHTKSYTGVDTYSITVKDSYDTLFEKQVAETKVYYDLYLCNTGDRHNSILHKIATELGFENKWDFQDVVDNKGQFLRVPFVLFEKDTRWIDELQTFMNATGGILYVKNGKLVFRPRNRSIDLSISLHSSNLMTSMEESEKTTNYNGIRLSYDRFEKLENQIVFNLAKKVSVKENTPVGSNVDAMRIEYITSSVSNPTLTKAHGYYFTATDQNSRVEVELQEGTHYVKEEWKETQAVVKFYNPYPHTLYIDSFEIKGVPLVKYENNEFDCKNKAVVAKNQENFILVPKNKYIQTKQFAEYFTKLEYANKIYPGKKYSFYSSLEGIEVAGVYWLSIEEIQDTIQVTGFTVFCEANNYRMQVEAETYVSTIPNVAYSSSYNLKGNSNYVDLSSIEKKVGETKKDLKTLDRDIHSRLFKSETEPQEDVQENDIWLNPKTNVWKKYYNNTWNPISEKEILPNMKMYNSLENNMIKLQGTADKVGAYLLNDGEQFGSMNGELAHVTFDKLGQFEAKNPNNRVALNIKDPANPYRVTSQVLLGVTDVTDSKWKNTIFAIGDEATGNRIEFKQGKLSQKINGQELEKKLSDVDKNIINLAQADSENKKELEKRIYRVKTNINAQLVNADKKWTALQGQYQETVRDVTSFKTQTSEKIDTVQGALQQGNFVITANTTFDGAARFVSRGSDEVITIANGSIDFHRDGKRLTRIKNIRHGIITTDSKGKGVVDFEGFQQPMIVVPSIKSLDAGKNMAKFFCFAEHIERCKYRFLVGVSNEYWVEATPIKVVGTQWSAYNALNSTFLKYEGKVDYGSSQKIQIYGSEGERKNYWKYIEYKLFPEINVKITRIDGNTTLLVDKNYKMTGGVDNWYVSGRYNLYFTMWLNVLDFSQTTNLLKRYANRTNVKFIMQVSITQPEFRAYIAHDWHYTTGNVDNKETTYYGVHKEVVLARITPSHLTGLALTASSSTSTLGEVTGEGEVSYIAMEID